MLTEARLKEVLHYDPSTGVFTALVVKPQRKGKVGGAEPSGRLRIRVDSKRYAAARLAWLYVTGEWPSDLVDHKNGDPSDNRLIARKFDCSVESARQAVLRVGELENVHVVRLKSKGVAS